MEKSTLGNGKMVKDVVKENNTGQMVPFMKVTGKIIKLMEKEG
jgi:hypothetical protein